jgi:hypothetical protein
VHEDVVPYALDALDDLERKRFERHLDGCDTCRHELVWLHETASQLAFAVPPAAAPAPPLRAPRRAWLPALAAVAAAAAAVLLVSSSGQDSRSVALAGAAGRLLVDRDRTARLDVHLPALGRGRHYEAWVLHDGRMLPAAHFTRGGMLMLRLHVRSGDRVAVTTEPDHTVVVRSERA